MDQTAQPTKSEPDLYYRSLKGGYWVISSRIAVNFLGFIKSLFLFNYFLLNDLGIISAAVMMMEIMSTLTQTGFESALIQKKEDIRDYLDTAWTAGLLKGIFLFAVLFSAAPLLAMFRIPQEKVPLAIWAFRAMSVCFLIQGFHNIGAVYFSKNLDFHKTFLLSAASSLTDIVLSISLVLILRSIWGVIAARLVSGIVTCIG
ncbi:MAG TPA: oligosaccharide flippase family protein, partial [Anaerohalosphaeraceae bacterium]|nr:oligosaccharide flippase family protein [Anaerohalosphaeraceae bacterium]